LGLLETRNSKLETCVSRLRPQGMQSMFFDN
jgi:hypothetical protein